MKKINKLSFLVVIIFNFQIFAQSNNTVSFSGNPTNDFNNAELKYGGDNVDYFITFDSSYLYLSAKRVNGSTFNEYDHLNFYIDTDPQSTPASGNGSTSGVNWDGNTPTLPFNADYRITIRKNGSSYWIHKHNSGSWADQSASGLTNWVGSYALQLRIPLSDLGSPDAIYFLAYMSYNGGFYAMNHGSYAISESGGTISGYYGGVGLKSSGATLWSTANSAITGSATNPTSGGKYGEVTINSDVTVNNSGSTEFEIISGGKLEISATNSLTVTGDFRSNGETILNSDSQNFSSLIVQGSSSGNITYSRYVNIEGSGEWDLIGPPVDGLDMTTFINNNSSLATNADSYAIGSYDNSTDEWTNYTLATANGNNVELGVGYQMATDSGTTLDFTGDVAITDQTTSIINNDGNGSGRRWNLVANPYPSYLNINSDADATDNFLTINLANGNVNIDAEFSAVYGWNADGTGYSSYDNNDTAKHMAPGQGFFVAASGSVDLDFTTAMRTVSGGDDFITGDAVEFPEVYLNLYNGDVVMGQTHIRFRDNMTLGLNPSYDVGSYNQNAAITTRLVEEDQGTNFEHQNLPINAIQNVTIPLVINQSAGQEFKVNLHTSTIYDSNIYLEDAEEGTFTNLYEGDFAMTPTSDLSGAGRFFIHITADTMSNEDVSTSMLNAYKDVNANYITIEGLATQSNNINVSLYNILGTKVLDTTLINNMNTQTLSTLGMASGIYVIELESGSDRLTKKLIIQ
mgnify:CR=1 FL=1